MKTKDIIKDLVEIGAFSQNQVIQILNFCESKVPGYSDQFWRLYQEAQETHDAECINLSSAGEIHYLISQSSRICFVIDFLKEAINLLGPNISVLDIGATQFTCLYKDLLGIKITALDRTNFLQKRFERHEIDFITCDFMRGEDINSASDTFDLCIFTEVFEHLVLPPKYVFIPLRRVLKKGGLLIFSTPNIAKFRNRIKLLLGKEILDPIAWVLRDDFDDESPHGIGHIREYTLMELEQLTSKYGFSTLATSYPVDSAFILSDSWSDRLNRQIYKIIPSSAAHCQILAQLQA